MTAPNPSSSGTEYVPADLAARIELYLDDAPMYGDHSDKAGGSCWELLREAMDELRAPSPSLEVLIQRWMADARQLDEAAKQEDIGDDEAALNKYCAEQLRRCIRDVEGIHGAAQQPTIPVTREAAEPTQYLIDQFREHGAKPAAQAASDALRAAAERVCWFDWSDNDMDAAAAIDALRKALVVSSTNLGGEATKNRGTFLGYKDRDGNEMHCANVFCPHEIKCRKGCANRVAISSTESQ